jgi:hypothetical protein
MYGHVRMVAWIFLLKGALMLGLALLVSVVSLLPGHGAAGLDNLGLAVFMGGLPALTSLPFILTGRGLLMRRPWARIAGIVLGVLSLPGVPVGTALAIYTLWVLLDRRTVVRFSGVPAP